MRINFMSMDDQRGNPTSTKVVADVIRFLISRPDVSGIIHGTCEDQCTRASKLNPIDCLRYE